MNENNANFTPEAPNFKTLVRMSFQGLTNFPYIEEDFDALANYGLLSKVVEYLNQVISNNNEQNDLMTGLYNAYVSLQDYVNNYFDVTFPEQINNKLDEMASDGTLENLLNDAAHLTKSYNTYEQMISDSEHFTNGLRIKTFGYYNINDGGGAEYYVTNTSNESYYQIELQNGLYLTLLNKDVINVKQLGVKGDGISDDTLLLQNVLDNFNNILIPKGTYLLSSLLITRDNINLSGENKTNTILKNINVSGNAFNFIGISNCNNVNISNVTINGDKKGANTPIAFVNVNNCELHDSIVTGGNSQRTINVQSFIANTGDNIKIYNNDVTTYGNIASGALIECTGERGEDTELHYLTNIEIINNKCIVSSGTYVGDSDLFDCIEIDNTKNCLIDKNYCNSILHKGISVDTRNIDFRVTNNYCTNMTIHGIESTGSLGETKGIISNNTIESVGTGIAINNEDILVIGNSIVNSTTRGIITLENAKNCVISSNYINGAGDGIYIAAQSTLISVIGNKTLNITNTNAGVVVPVGTGPGIEVYSTENSTSLTLSRIKGYNGVIVDRVPAQNNTIFIQGTRLRYKDSNGAIYTIDKTAD